MAISLRTQIPLLIGGHDGFQPEPLLKSCLIGRLSVSAYKWFNIYAHGPVTEYFLIRSSIKLFRGSLIFRWLTQMLRYYSSFKMA